LNDKSNSNWAKLCSPVILSGHSKHHDLCDLLLLFFFSFILINLSHLLNIGACKITGPLPKKSTLAITDCKYGIWNSRITLTDKHIAIDSFYHTHNQILNAKENL